MSASGTSLAVVVEGLRFTIDASDEPRVLDLQIGERLGYDRPRDFRKLIRRLERLGVLRPGEHFDARDTVAQTSGGRPTREYLLNEAGVLTAMTRSEKPPAIAVVSNMVAAFRAVLHRRREAEGAFGAGAGAAFVPSRRVGEVAELRLELLERVRLIVQVQTAALGTPVPIQRVLGALRRHFGVSSHLGIPVVAAAELRRVLAAMLELRWRLEQGRVRRRAPAADPRQLALPALLGSTNGKELPS